MKKHFATIDGNEAVARIAYRLNEVIAIYPITSSSAMGEWTDAWSAEEHPIYHYLSILNSSSHGRKWQKLS
jgi:pyruvate-ferredoxin/flavodoxin oxidoreductase